MDTKDITARLKQRQKTNKRYIHSAAHALADKLAKDLGDTKHFGAYLKLAQKHDHQKLLMILGNVLENPNAKSKARLFMFLVKNGKA